MKENDIRWKQRFQNFEKAFMRLKDALEMGELNELERNGLIQRFKFTRTKVGTAMNKCITCPVSFKSVFSPVQAGCVLISAVSKDLFL
jgi:hypothetical protein